MKTPFFKKFIYFSFLTISSLSNAKERLIIVDNTNDQILKQEGDDCEKRLSPCSTFKIALSLMGYNENILIDETTPEWPFLEGYNDYSPKWRASHNPKSWMSNSCVWYSQLLTPQLGLSTIENYLAAFDYGNQDMSGDSGKDNGLTEAWLDSSLEISPLEQVEFLKKIIRNDLPVSAHSLEMTRRNLYLEDLDNDWILYGKTGSGFIRDEQGEIIDEVGWLIGWVEKEDQRYIYVMHLQDKSIPVGVDRIPIIKRILKDEDILH